MLMALLKWDYLHTVHITVVLLQAQQLTTCVFILTASPIQTQYVGS